jgi:hypothetical protein
MVCPYLPSCPYRSNSRNLTSKGSCLRRWPILARRALSRLFCANYGMDCRLKLAEKNPPVRSKLLILLHFGRFYNCNLLNCCNLAVFINFQKFPIEGNFNNLQNCNNFLVFINCNLQNCNNLAVFINCKHSLLRGILSVIGYNY